MQGIFPGDQDLGVECAIPGGPRWGAFLDQQESDMMAALDSFGPLPVCGNAETRYFYTSGVFSRRCSGAEPSPEVAAEIELRQALCSRDASARPQRRGGRGPRAGLGAGVGRLNRMLISGP